MKKWNWLRMQLCRCCDHKGKWCRSCFQYSLYQRILKMVKVSMAAAVWQPSLTEKQGMNIFLKGDGKDE